MNHEWTIRQVQRELETLRSNNAGYERGNRLEKEVLSAIARNQRPEAIVTESDVARIVKSRLKDFWAVLDTTAPFGQVRVDAERQRMIADKERHIQYYAEKVIPANEAKIRELEYTLSVLEAEEKLKEQAEVIPFPRPSDPVEAYR